MGLVDSHAHLDFEDYAQDLDGALGLMQKREIAVVITDVDAEHEELSAMLKLLKQETPQILTIVITRTSDAEMIVATAAIGER